MSLVSVASYHQMTQVTTNNDQREHTVTITTGVSSWKTKRQNEESTPRLQFNNNSVIHENEAGTSPFTMYQYWPILSHLPLFVKLDSEGKITNMTMVNKLTNNNDTAKLSLFNKKYYERAVCCFLIGLKSQFLVIHEITILGLDIVLESNWFFFDTIRASADRWWLLCFQVACLVSGCSLIVWLAIRIQFHDCWAWGSGSGTVCLAISCCVCAGGLLTRCCLLCL